MMGSPNLTGALLVRCDLLGGSSGVFGGSSVFSYTGSSVPRASSVSSCVPLSGVSSLSGVDWSSSTGCGLRNVFVAGALGCDHVAGVGVVGVGVVGVGISFSAVRGWIFFRCLLFLSLTLLLPSVTTVYYRLFRHSTTLPVVSHLFGFGPVAFCMDTTSPTSNGIWFLVCSL